MSPPYAAAASPSLSVDDVLMGEILMSLKRDPQPPAQDPLAFRDKVELKVEVSRSAAGHTHAQPPPSAFSFASFASVSPMASTAYKAASLPIAPTDKATASSSGTTSTVSSAVTPLYHSAKRYGPVVQLEDLRQCFNLPIAAVARKFGICATLLKKICRRHGIQRWPHRQIRSLQKSIDMLRESLAVAKGSNKEYIAKKIAAFELTLECIMQDPNTAAKGISAGRLAAPAGDARPGRALSAPMQPKKPAAMSDDEGSSPAPNAAMSARLAQRRSSMSLESILC